jgi:hypothetical protein
MTNNAPPKLEHRLRIFAVFIVLGLVLELISLGWVHPVAFLLFAILGCGFLFIGISGYLYSIVSIPIEAASSKVD